MALTNPACTCCHYIKWINGEEEFLRTDRDKIRDGDLDETFHTPPITEGERNHDRSIAKGSRAKAHAAPRNPQQVRNAQAVERRSHGGCRQSAAYAADRTHARSQHESNAEDEDCASILDGLEEEERHAHRSDHELLGRSLEHEKEAYDCTPLDQVDRTRIRLLLKNKNLDMDDRVAIQWFLGEFRRSKWMHWQGFYPERIAMNLLSPWHRGRDIAYCGYAGRFCHEPDFCPRCAVLDRADLVVTEYDGLFDKLLPDGQRRYFYAITLSYDWNPDRAGLHYVIEKRDPAKGAPDKLKHEYPFKGKTPVEPLTIDNDIGEENNISACFRAIFALAKFLSKLSHQWGVLAHRHIAWRFFEYPGLAHHIRPHGHLLVVADEPITFEVGKLLLDRFRWSYHKQKFGGVLYCDAHISPLISQAEIERWMFYMFAPMDYVRPYRDAVQRGVNIETLNHEVDNCVFHGGNFVLSSVPSPVRYGALHVNVGPNRYLGAKNVTLQREEAQAAKEAKRRNHRRSLKRIVSLSGTLSDSRGTKNFCGPKVPSEFRALVTINRFNRANGTSLTTWRNAHFPPAPTTTVPRTAEHSCRFRSDPLQTVASTQPLFFEFGFAYWTAAGMGLCRFQHKIQGV